MTQATNSMPSGAGSRRGQFTLQLLTGRWFMMFASFLIMSMAGATYLFGVYSKVIKTELGYDQSTLNLLSTFKDLGANVGVLSGLIAEVAPVWAVLLIGSAMNFVGYFMIWLSVCKKISKPSVWQMCAYICIGANSQNFANTGSLVTCVKNFPESRGMLLGLMKGFIGLSGAIFTQLYLAIYGSDGKSLILLIGWLPAVVSVLFVFNIRIMQISRHPNEVKVFQQYLVISIVLALCLGALTVAQKFVIFSHVGYILSATGVCFLLFLPLLIAIREELATWNLRKKRAKEVPSSIIVEEPQLPKSTNAENESEIVELPPEGSEKEESTGFCSNVWNKPKRGQDYSILQALLSIDMLIIFVATFCGLGSSLTAIDNLGQIGESLGYPQRTISTFVSLVSIWNYFGRVFAGFVSEMLLTKWRVPRTYMMTASLVLPAIGDIIIAFPSPVSVYVASLLIGFSFGVQLTLLFIITSELFGLKYFATLFNCCLLASPLGSYVFNVVIVGKLYDYEALKLLTSKGMTREMVKELTCIGNQCYRTSFVVLAGANLFGAVVSLILVYRTKEYYKTDIYKRFRDEMEANEKEMSVVNQR